MTKRELRFFKTARRMSQFSTFPKIHIGAVIVKKNKILGKGTNLYKTHPKQKKYNGFNPNFKEDYVHLIHAEISAIINTGSTNLHGCVIYVYRENKHGQLAMSRPCMSCMALLKAVGIRTIYYTTPDGFCKEIISI